MTDHKLAESLIGALNEKTRVAMTKAAAQRIDATNFSIYELQTVFETILNQTQVGQILTYSSYLEDKLKEVLVAAIKSPEAKKLESDFFRHPGPLSTHASRMMLARHLGWLSKGTVSGLDAVRSIRNEFAHRAYKVSFGDPAIKGKLDKIHASTELYWKSFKFDIHKRAPPKVRQLLGLLLLLRQALIEILVHSTIQNLPKQFFDSHQLKHQSRVLQEIDDEFKKALVPVLKRHMRKKKDFNRQRVKSS
jgi:hypothetical protein